MSKRTKIYLIIITSLLILLFINRKIFEGKKTVKIEKIK